MNILLVTLLFVFPIFSPILLPVAKGLTGFCNDIFETVVPLRQRTQLRRQVEFLG
jgi:hypothetical protein